MRRVMSMRAAAAVFVATRCAGSPALATTPIARKDPPRGGDRGDPRRLTFSERAERRAGRPREQKATREGLLREAETVVHEDVPAELEQVFMQHFERANVSAMKVLNMAKCLELLETDVGSGRKVLLTRVAQVLKTSNSTIEIVPQSASFASAILQRVARFDGTLQVTREQQKIKVVIPPMTTVRREKAVGEIRQLLTSFRQKAKAVRMNASRALQEAGIEESAMRELHMRLDETVNTFVEEKVLELEQLAADVTSMGSDESDMDA